MVSSAELASRQNIWERENELKRDIRERRALGTVGKAAQTEYRGSLSDFARDTQGTAPQISRLQQLIRQRALPEQRRAMSQGRLALQQQGVRGPEAALMQQMQANKLQEVLANKAEQVALQQALSDRGQRQQLASKRALLSLEPGFKAGLDYKTPEQEQEEADRARIKAQNQAAIQRQITRRAELKAKQQSINEALGIS
tara:strand:- start:247 stop:843 length:597 start_codon:yes stop_codon:yes gene_type:complete